LKRNPNEIRPLPAPIEKHTEKPKLRNPPYLVTTSIKDHFSRASNLGATGLGRHLIMDFFHWAAIFPGTPSYIICATDPEIYAHIRNVLPIFMARFASDDYYRIAGSVTNSKNPFAFNTKVNDLYISQYIDVFRRIKVEVGRELFHRFLKKGYLDKHHTMGIVFPPYFLSAS